MSRPPRSYRLIQSFFNSLMRLFFREVEVVGRENVPTDGGGVLVSWHPNGLIDPGLILTQFPRQVVFGARHGLFRWPVLGFILRSVGTVPIYRKVDLKNLSSEARRKANQGSLAALAAEVSRGSFSALFPEGISHDEPKPTELKTGAARLYFQAVRDSAEAGRPTPVVLPVGLFYDGKRLFRSRALVEFHPPMEIPEELVGSEPDDGEGARALTEEIERELHDAVHATDDWALHYLLHRSRKLIRAERALRSEGDPGPTNIAEKALGFARMRIAYYERLKTHPAQVERLRARVEAYDSDLRALRLEDHELDRDPRLASPWLAILLVLQVVFVFLLGPPILVLGYLVNGPPALALIGMTKLAARRKKDEATIKLLVGAVLFPATWILVGVLGAFLHEILHATYPAVPDAPISAGLILALLSAVGGAMALRYLHRAQSTARAVRVRLTRRRRRAAIGALRIERAALYDALIALAEGLELPGVVSEDGSLRPG